MIYNRIFFSRNENKHKNSNLSTSFFKKCRKETVHIAIFSNFFCEMESNLFCTNEMYTKLKNSVLASISVCHVKEKIALDVFETKESDKETRELIVIGFRKYIDALYQQQRRMCINQFLQVLFFAFIGVLAIFFLNLFKPNFPEWIIFCLETAGTVLLWELVGFLAYEFPGQKREMNRLKQMKAMEFCFSRWE